MSHIPQSEKKEEKIKKMGLHRKWRVKREDAKGTGSVSDVFCEESAGKTTAKVRCFPMNMSFFSFCCVLCVIFLKCLCVYV